MENSALTAGESQALVKEMLRAGRIRYVLHTDVYRRGHAIGLALYADDPEAAKSVGLLAEVVVACNTELLGLLGIRGERN